MRILVIGGSVFIGKALVEYLLQDGHEVAVFNRGNSVLDARVLQITGSREDLPKYHSEFEKFAPEVVVHNIAYQEKHAHDVMNTFSGIARRVVLVSSMDVYRVYGILIGQETCTPLKGIQDEKSELRGQLYPHRSSTTEATDPMYHYDKIPVEKVVLEHSELFGTVVRLPMVIGPHDSQNRLFPLWKPMMDNKEYLVLAEEYANWKSTYDYVGNIAKGIALACKDTSQDSQVFNLGKYVVSARDLASTVQKIIGWNGKILTAPAASLPKSFNLGIQTKQNLQIASNLVTEKLGYTEDYSWEEGVEKTIEWMNSASSELPYDYADQIAAYEAIHKDK